MAESNNNLNFDDELLSAYVDGELTTAERAAVEARLQSDPAAREMVVEIQALSGTLRSLPKLAVAEDMRSAVLAQVSEKKSVALPEYRPGPLRRLMWPAIAVAAALLLMFTQDEQPENGDLAKVEVRGGEQRDQPAEERHTLSFEAPETDVAPAATTPAAEEIAVVDDGASAGVAIGSDLVQSELHMNGRSLDAITAADAELGIVHLTLTDFRAGTERFDRLLLSNGVQVLDDSASSDGAGDIAGAVGIVAADSAIAESAPSTRSSSAPTGGFGGAAPTPSASESQPTEPEMVLVEAAPAQIEKILFTCSNDTEAIESVSIDPSASGTNLLPEKQRLLGYHQYERAAGNRAEAKGYNITAEQQGVIAVLNSMSLANETAEPSISRDSAAGLQQQGWATKFRADQQPQQLRQLENEVNQRKKLAKEKSIAENSMRVLFFLHPSEDSAVK